jgi:hypothetical protein
MTKLYMLLIIVICIYLFVQNAKTPSTGYINQAIDKLIGMING